MVSHTVLCQIPGVVLTFGSGPQSTVLDYCVALTQLSNDTTIFFVHQDDLPALQGTVRALYVTLSRFEVARIVRRQLFFRRL